MFNISKRVPLGVAALAVVSLLGLKDTGIFISDHVQTTYSGNQVYFEAGEKAEIIETSVRGYVVTKGAAKVTIPMSKIAVTEVTTSTYKVIQSVAIKNDENQILRNLFLGEIVTLNSKKDGIFNVTTADGITGNVAVEALEFNSSIVKSMNKEEAIVKAKTFGENEIKMTVNKSRASVANVSAVVSYSAEAVSSTAQAVVYSASNKLGAPYIYGSTGSTGYDCSGLVYAVYKNEFGVNLPRTSMEQSKYGKQVSRNELQPGDLVFFNTRGSGVSHVGIYKGNGYFIHASTSQGKVITSNLSEDYYNERYVNATRVL